MMDWKQRSYLSINKLPYGGYVVSDAYGVAVNGGIPLFSGTLGQCLDFIQKSITFDEKNCAQPPEEKV